MSNDNNFPPTTNPKLAAARERWAAARARRDAGIPRAPKFNPDGVYERLVQAQRRREGII